MGGGTAAGLWSASGTGNAAGSVTVAVPLAITAGTPTGDLYPGHVGGLVLTVGNSNAYPVRVTGLSFDPGAVTSSNESACSQANVTPVAKSSLTLDVPAGTTRTFTVPGTLSLSSTAPDGCQGVSFTVVTSAVGQQS